MPQIRVPQIPYQLTADIIEDEYFFNNFYYAINMNENKSCDITISTFPSAGFD